MAAIDSQVSLPLPWVVSQLPHGCAGDASSSAVTVTMIRISYRQLVILTPIADLEQSIFDIGTVIFKLQTAL